MFNKRNIIIESNIWNQQNREMLIIFIFTFLFLILVFYTIYFDQTFCPTRISSLSFPNSQSAQIHILSLSEKKKKQNRQATTTNTWNTHPEMGMYLSNPSRLRTPCERGSRKIIRAKVVGDSKETVFSDTAELTHIWTHRDGTAWTGPAQTHKLKPNKMPIQRGGSGHKVPSPAKKPFPIDSQLQVEKAFSLIE